MGAKVRVLPVENAGGVLVAEWNSGSPKAPLLFIGHVDTVFKEGTAEDNPFRIDEQGRAHGPGVLDMKSRPCHCRPRHQGPGCRCGFTGRPVKCVFAGDEENLHMLSNAKQVMTEEIKVPQPHSTSRPASRTTVWWWGARAAARYP
ncbi:MAG: M20/M25/M40 family metallo-hydrolase [Butyricicoccus sp.]